MNTETRRPANRATFSLLPAGVTLMRASFADHAFERHSHDCFALGATTHGIQRFRCKGRQYDSRPDDVVLFNPDDDHDGRPGTADGFRYTIWYVPTALVAAALPTKRPAMSRAPMPPHVYLNAVRVAEAQKRIRLGMPLASVALECGFADQSHLTRRFKGSVGVTPAAWRSVG